MGGATPSRILVLGIDGAGKTTFLNKIEKPKMDKATEPTESYEQRDMKQGGIAFSVWDVSGKPSTRSLWSSYYKQGNIDAIVYVVDAADRNRLEETKKVLQQQLRDPELNEKMLFVVANKKDLDNAMSADELEKELKLHSFDGKRVWNIVSCSAKTGSGVKDAMKKLGKEVKKEIKRIEKGQSVPEHGDDKGKSKDRSHDHHSRDSKD
jgi:small GTP-binding protein